jgi:MoaA/NifB/PqqE/SkfB family radical SAM enzyme
MSAASFDRLKGYVSSRLLEKIVETSTSDDEGKLADLFELLSKLSPARYYKESFHDLARMAREDHPATRVFRRIFTDLHPNCRRKAISNFFVNFLLVGRDIRDRKEAELGVHLPNFMVISPTMRCNLRCKGCYAAGYSKEDDMPSERIDRLIDEAKELGMYFFTFSGGECFVRPDLLELWKKHHDCFFQVYTNGTLLDDVTVGRLVKLGNVAPMVSVEGSREETDMRRGRGMYDRVMETFGRLSEAGLLFGFSATCTRSSADHIATDAFLEEMLDHGCKVGWFFQYIPTGDDPDLGYMATPTQRAALHKKVTEWRRKYPIFLGDFWNDGPFVDGCMAGGERYLHVISSGDVEPCVFVHFAVDNINDKSLLEVIQSPFFRDIRDRQPYDDDNLLCPCMVIDHPHVLREVVKTHGARATHPGSERILTELSRGLDDYSGSIHKLFDPLWEGGEREQYLKSLEREDKQHPQGRFNKRLPTEQRTG